MLDTSMSDTSMLDTSMSDTEQQKLLQQYKRTFMDLSYDAPPEYLRKYQYVSRRKRMCGGSGECFRFIRKHEQLFKSYVNVYHICGLKAIHYMSMMNNRDVVDYILSECNGDVNSVTDYGYTPLHYASQNGNCDTMSLLLQYGAHVNSVTIYNETPFHRAVACRQIQNMRLLVNSGADVTINRINTRVMILQSILDIQCEHLSVMLMCDNVNWVKDFTLLNECIMVCVKIGYSGGDVKSIKMLLESVLYD